MVLQRYSLDGDPDSTHRKREYVFYSHIFHREQLLTNIFHFKGNCSARNKNLGVKKYFVSSSIDLFIFFLSQNINITQSLPNNITLAMEAHPRKSVINPPRSSRRIWWKLKCIFTDGCATVYLIWKILNKAIPHFCFIPWKQLLHEKVDRQDTVNKQRLKSCHRLRNVLENKRGLLANNLTLKYRNEKPILRTYTYLYPTSQFDEARDTWPNPDCFYRNMTSSQRREPERLSLHIKSKLQMEKNSLLSEQDSIKKRWLALTGQIPGIECFHRSRS